MTLVEHTPACRTFERPTFAFDPDDPWTQTFQEGLRDGRLDDRVIYEVGIGTGSNVAYALEACGAAKVFGSDLDPRLVELSERNVRIHLPHLAERFEPVKGSVSLVDTPKARALVAQAEVVVACLPQVGDPADGRLAAFRNAQRVKLCPNLASPSEDHIAHYYPWSEFDEYPYNAVGLGLNEALLRRLRQYAPTADVIMNFGCRVGIGVVLEFFKANGYRPRVLASRLVRQHAGTDISFFAAMECAMEGVDLDRSIQCEFYADADGRTPLSARSAQARMQRDPNAECYHAVSVVHGEPFGR